MIQPVRTRKKSIEHAFGTRSFPLILFQYLSRERFNQRHWKLDRHTYSVYDITSGIPVAFFHNFFTIKKPMILPRQAYAHRFYTYNNQAHTCRFNISIFEMLTLDSCSAAALALYNL